MTTNKSYLLSRCAVPQRPRPEGTSSQQWGDRPLVANATAAIFLVSLLSSKATEVLKPMTRKGISVYFWQTEDDADDEIPRAPYYYLRNTCSPPNEEHGMRHAPCLAQTGLLKKRLAGFLHGRTLTLLTRTPTLSAFHGHDDGTSDANPELRVLLKPGEPILTMDLINLTYQPTKKRERAPNPGARSMNPEGEPLHACPNLDSC